MPRRQVGRAGAHLAAAISALDVADARMIARRMSVCFFAVFSSVTDLRVIATSCWAILW